MADDGEFEYLVKNSQRMVRLNNQYENHLYVEEFIKECNVMFVYRTHILEGGACAKFSLEFISGRNFTKPRKQFLQANEKLYEGVGLPTKNIRSSTEHRDRQAST